MMTRYAMGLVVMMAASPLLGCYAAEAELDDARDRALAGGEGDDFEAAGPEAIALMQSLGGYYVLTEGHGSEGALHSLWLGEAAEVTAGGVIAGESRRRAADLCEGYSCGFVIGDTYRALPATFGINQGYLLLDAASDDPTEFYIIRHIERDDRGEVKSLELRYSPSPDVVGEPFVITRWDRDTQLRPDLEISTMAGLPGHFVREDVQPAAGEITSVQFGADEAARDGEQGGSFIRQVALSCASFDCNREAGDRYLAMPRNFIGISYIVFHEGTEFEDAYLVDEVVRDEVGTIVRLSVRHWGDEIGQPFALARLGYGE
jgi:hypothetical protein